MTTSATSIRSLVASSMSAVARKRRLTAFMLLSTSNVAASPSGVAVSSRTDSLKRRLIGLSEQGRRPYRRQDIVCEFSVGERESLGSGAAWARRDPCFAVQFAEAGVSSGIRRGGLGGRGIVPPDALSRSWACRDSAGFHAPFTVTTDMGTSAQIVIPFRLCESGARRFSERLPRYRRHASGSGPRADWASRSATFNAQPAATGRRALPHARVFDRCRAHRGDCGKLA